ncbi:MAG: HNH endonuclease [Paludibacteraceae bacterium]|nr:HNH endonuclease [Paludibacteraceae bacterium]
MVVYVLDKEGRPLMPTSRNRKVRMMLKEGLCHVERKIPFTIRLDYETTGFTQDVTLGVDTGTRHIGLSASTSEKELFSAEVTLRNDITELLSTRRESRRSRRHRLRYRKPRFLNRVHSKNKGWLAPSVENRIDTHLGVMRKIHRILPVTRVVLEVGSFDTQKLLDDGITGEGYQHGVQYNFWNVREYVLARDGHKCQCCKGKSKDLILNVHHIESRKTGGDSPGNLITLCETCHRKYHNGSLKGFNPVRSESLRSAALMSAMKWRLFETAKNEFDDVRITYGYITKTNRMYFGLPKGHNVDAYCIAQNFEAERLLYSYKYRQLRKHNRQIHKMKINKGGMRKMNQTPYLLFGFRLFDKVRYEGRECFVGGRRKRGDFKLVDIDNRLIKDGVSYKKLEFVGHRESHICSMIGLTI